jgi:uncharacterized protein with PQ loop repeat
MLNILKEFFGVIMAGCFVICYIPQIFKIFKTKSSKDLSLLFVIMPMIGYISGLLYLVLSQSFVLWLVLNYTIGLVMTIFLLVIYYKYKN